MCFDEHPEGEIDKKTVTVLRALRGHKRFTYEVDVQKLLLVYTMYMRITEPLNITEARKQLATIIDQARTDHDPVYLTRRGRRVAAVIDADDLDGILALAEDMADIRAAEDARAEMRATCEAPIPWEQVKVDLGLV